MPYYITAPPVRNTNIAVSVRASQLGAMPADAVHDAQIPRYGPHGVRANVPTRPVYVEIGKDYQLPNAPVGAAPQVAFHHTSSASSGVGSVSGVIAKTPAHVLNGGGLYQVPYIRLPYYGYHPTFIY